MNGLLACMTGNLLFKAPIVAVKEAVLAMQRARLHGRWRYIFIESVITDEAVLQQNYRYKMMYSPDYQNQDPSKVASWPTTHLALPLIKALDTNLGRYCRPWRTFKSASGSMTANTSLSLTGDSITSNSLTCESSFLGLVQAN